MSTYGDFDRLMRWIIAKTATEADYMTSKRIRVYSLVVNGAKVLRVTQKQMRAWIVLWLQENQERAYGTGSSNPVLRNLMKIGGGSATKLPVNEKGQYISSIYVVAGR